MDSRSLFVGIAMPDLSDHKGRVSNGSVINQMLTLERLVNVIAAATRSRCRCLLMRC
jgi:hypothetical protein